MRQKVRGYPFMISTAQFPPASLLKRCAALIYDAFIIFSLLMILTAIALCCTRGQSLKPYQGYFLIYLFVGIGLFLSWFWCKRGQTLGMLAWKIQVLDKNYRPLTWRKAFVRYILSFLNYCLCGIGLLWCLIDKEKQSLHDQLAGTKVISTHIKDY